MNTSPAATPHTAKISSALLRARRNAGSPAMGMVLTLLVVCEEKEYESALKAAMESGREHPARILLIVTASGRTASPSTPSCGSVRGRPVRSWCCGCADRWRRTRPRWSGRCCCRTPPSSSGGPARLRPRAPTTSSPQLSVRRVTDAAAAKRPLAELKARARDYQPGDTDLSWTRLTRWRALLAAALDQYPARIKGATVEAERNSPSADLLAAWLQSCLKVKVARKITPRTGDDRGADDHRRG